MDCCYTPSLIPFEQGLQNLLDAVQPLLTTEQVPLAQLDGRIVATPLLSPVAVPPADNSAMDGYALLASDASEPNARLKLIGQSFAGHVFQGELQAGECVRIMTGAVIPHGATAVIMQEQTQVSDCGHWVELTCAVQPQQNIRYAGEDIQIAQPLFEVGYRLKAVDLGLLASMGIAQASVYQRPRVALISNGDELVEPGGTLAAGQLFESNRFGLAALLRRLGLAVTEFGIIPDQPELLRQAMLAAAEYDAVISSGGVSVGEADFIKPILDELGHIDFWKLAIKPGKPFAYGKLGNAHYFGLPGNPVSALVTCHQLAVPALRQLAGEVYQAQPLMHAVATESVRKRVGITDFQRGYYHCNEQGQLQVRTTGKQGSGILSSISRANCFMVLAQQSSGVTAGDVVTILPFDQLLS